MEFKRCNIYNQFIIFFSVIVTEIVKIKKTRVKIITEKVILVKISMYDGLGLPFHR